MRKFQPTPIMNNEAHHTNQHRHNRTELLVITNKMKITLNMIHIRLHLTAAIRILLLQRLH